MTSARPPFASAHKRQPALAGYDRPISRGQSARARNAAAVLLSGHWSNNTAVARERSHIEILFSSASHGRLLMNKPCSWLQYLLTVAASRWRPHAAKVAAAAAPSKPVQSGVSAC